MISHSKSQCREAGTGATWYPSVMSSPNAARVSDIDPVAAAVANAPEDDREVTAPELEALREARADRQPFVSGATMTASIAERSQRDE